MSLHQAEWHAVLEEIKQDLPWLLKLWHEIRSGNPDESKPFVDVVDVKVAPVQGELAIGQPNVGDA